MSNRGFGLTQILIASVVIGILAMAISRSLTQSFKRQNTVSANTALDNHLAVTSLLLKNSDACVSSLGAAGASSTGLIYSAATGIPNITLYEPKLNSAGGYDPGTQVLAASNFSVPKASGKYMEVSILPAKKVIVADTEYLASLHFSFDQAAGTTVGAQNKSRDIPISITTNSLGKITACHTTGAGYSPLANQNCPEGEMMTGFDAQGLPICDLPNLTTKNADLGILGPTDPPPPGTNALTCDYPDSMGHMRTVTCDSARSDCNYVNGQWVLSQKTPGGVTMADIKCSGGVTVDFPPDNAIAKAGTDFFAVDPSTTKSSCFTSTEDEKPCVQVVTTQQGAAPVAATSVITVTSLSGNNVTKTVSGIKFGSTFYAASATNSVCAYVAGQWKVYRGPSGTNCDSMTFLPQ